MLEHLYPSRLFLAFPAATLVTIESDNDLDPDFDTEIDEKCTCTQPPSIFSSFNRANLDSELVIFSNYNRVY